MNFTVHTMEYAGGRAETSLDLRNYRDSDYEEYRAMYNGCFLAMRTALGIRPAECCKTREELAQSRSEIWVLERSGVLAGSVAVYGNEIDDLVVKGDFQGRGLGRALLQWALALLEAAALPVLLFPAILPEQLLHQAVLLVIPVCSRDRPAVPDRNKPITAALFPTSPLWSIRFYNKC